MPTELEDLVAFLHHGITTIRQLAVENLVGYSHAQPVLFKANNLEPIRDLKLLVKDHPPIAKNALTILVNLSVDPAILENIAGDDEFVKSILVRVTDPKMTNVTELSMLIANLSKHASFQKVLSLKLPPRNAFGTSLLAIDHLLSVFLLGESGKYNPTCTYEYLAYSFAELARFEEARKYFTTPRADDDDNIPLSKMLVFTEHKNDIRRRGVANTIKNVCFEIPAHPRLLSVLPHILLPLMGSETYPDDEMDAMPDELQLLPPDKEREKDLEIMKTHLEILLLLSTTKEGRDKMRAVQVYPIVRECHLGVDDDEVRESCDRYVNVIIRDEEGEEASKPAEGQVANVAQGGFADVMEETRAEKTSGKVTEVDSDDEIIDIL